MLFELPLFSKKPKKLSNYQLSKELPFFPKKSKNLNKCQILKYILPLYYTVGIWRSQYAYKETYNVEFGDTISLSDSLCLAKSSIINLLQEKRGFKYILSTTITLKIRNNTTNTYDAEKGNFNSEAIMFYLELGFNFVINLVATFSESKSDDSGSDFNSVFISI